MLRTLLFAVATLAAVGAAAQPSTPDSLEAADGWLQELGLQFAGSQAQYSNWQEGGVNSLAFSTQSEGVFYRVSGSLRQAHEVRLALGLLKQDTLSPRKADDVARYAFGLEYDTGSHLRPSLSLMARTQFISGFDYTPEAEEYPTLPRQGDGRVKVSDAFAPLVLSQSAGVVYDPGAGFSARVGVGLKETVVSIERLRPVYGNALDQSVRVQAGVDSELRFKRRLMENVTFTSRLSAFQAFNQVGSVAPDVLFENRVVLQVNPILNVTLDAATLFDRDVSADLQFRESLAVGIGFSLL